MIKDKDVNLYLKKRQEVEAPNHHDLLPTQLREERLKQLKLDNLIGPELKKVFDTQIRSFDNYQLDLRVYIPFENEKNKKSNQTGKTIKQSIEELEIEMDKAASNLEFEEAAKIRDEIKKLKQKELGLMIVPKENNRK